MGRSIILAKPNTDLITHPGETFTDGERVILVDGVRWGRTVVTRHGVHGTKTWFEQEGGDRVTVRGVLKGGRRDVYVRSANPREARRFIDGEYRLPDDFRATATLVLAQVIELVDTGALRDPAVVRRESEARRAEHARRLTEGAERERQAFRKRAIEALTVGGVMGYTEQMIGAVIAAMIWAQEQ